MNQPERDDRSGEEPVWELIQHASKVEASSLFARNVVREVRLDSAHDSGWLATLKTLFTPRFAMIGSMAAAAIAVALVLLFEPGSNMVPEVTFVEVEEFDPASELEEVEYLGQLMAVVDPGQLSDEALGDLFF